MSDEALMRLFTDGDAAAFATLVRRHQKALYNYALRRLGSGAAAEETVQEAFVRVARSAAEFNPSSRFAAWLYAIVRNLCIDAVRKRAVRRHSSLDAPSRRDDDTPLGETAADAHANVERTVVAHEIRERVLVAVEALPTDQRDVFLLREVASLSFKEIAQVVGASENTVKSRMRYALERLKEALSDFEEYARALR